MRTPTVPIELCMRTRVVLIYFILNSFASTVGIRSYAQRRKYAQF